MSDAILLANPSGVTATVGMSLAGVMQPATTVPPDSVVAVHLLGRRGGPLIVSSVQQGTTTPLPIAVVERTIWANELNDLWGIPAGSLSATNVIVSYDSVDTNGEAWIMLANTGTRGVSATISVSGTAMYTGVVAAGVTQPVVLTRTIGGPVVVTSVDAVTGAPAPLAVTLRSFWHGNSLQELPGTPRNAIGSDNFFAWYDSVTSTVSSDAIVVVNPTTSTEVVTVSVGSSVRVSLQLRPGQAASRSFTRVQGGPVEVHATAVGSWQPRQVLTVQQTVWLGGGEVNNELPTQLTVPGP